MRVEEYVRPDGSSPFQKWFKALSAEAAAKVATASFRLSQGNTSNVKWLGGIGEYRIDWGPSYRIYLVQDGAELIILLGGGTKKRQARDIKAATMLHEEYRARKAALEKAKSDRKKR
jgi:putative addiction module killer protein